MVAAAKATMDRPVPDKPGSRRAMGANRMLAARARRPEPM